MIELHEIRPSALSGPGLLFEVQHSAGGTHTTFLIIMIELISQLSPLGAESE